MQLDDAHDINIVRPMYYLIEYRDNYSKTSGILWKYYTNQPNVTLAGSTPFKSKIKIAGKNSDDNTKHV